jgi:type VI secretion system secreted protein Hcp
MNDILITSVQPSGTNEYPLESVSLQLSKINLEYKPQKDDGSLDAGVFFKYDIKAIKKR